MKDIEYYMGLPYNYIIQPINDETGEYFYAKVLELDGCQSTGDSFEEAYKSLREAMKEWIEIKLEHRISIPEPIKSDSYSGKFVIRMPKSLHYQLSIEAQEEGVSLNQYALYKLSR